MIFAEVIADSISPVGARITTMHLRLPTIILAELNTHRMLSRNAASARAIPAKTMIAKVRADPFVPLHWGKNQPGMQARDEVDEDTQALARGAWMIALENALESAEHMASMGVHKQIVNRLLAPFSWTDVVVTSTEWDNFFAQRCHPDAEPHMQRLAWAMSDAIAASEPMRVRMTSWHLPYVLPQEYEMSDDVLCRVSAARCARVSYHPPGEKEPDIQKDLALYDRLVGNREQADDPRHWSPLEHVARPLIDADARRGNLTGWSSLRWETESRPSRFSRDAAITKGWRPSARS